MVLKKRFVSISCHILVFEKVRPSYLFLLYGAPNQNRRSLSWNLINIIRTFLTHSRQFWFLTNTGIEILHASENGTRLKNYGLFISSIGQFLANEMLLCLFRAMISSCICSLYGLTFETRYRTFHIVVWYHSISVAVTLKTLLESLLNKVFIISFFSSMLCGNSFPLLGEWSPLN